MFRRPRSTHDLRSGGRIVGFRRGRKSPNLAPKALLTCLPWNGSFGRRF